MHTRTLVSLFTLAACGGSSAPKSTTPKQEAVDSRSAEKGAKDLLGEIYESIDHADTDGLMSLLADPLVVYGPRRADALTTRADALVALKQHVDAKKKNSLKSGSLEVVASPGGHSAWAYDVIDVAGEPMAITAILSNTDDIWQVSAAALAHTPSMKSVRTELKKDAVVPPGMTGPAKVDGNAKGAVEKFQKGLADPNVWGDDLGSRSDAVVIGPSNGDITKGKSEIKKLWKRRAKSNTREVAAGEISAAATADGQLAWVSAPVVKFAEDDEPMPLRAFAIYEKDGGDWKLIALQESLALDEPGAGAPFKKTQAPAVKQEEKKPEAKPAETKPAKKGKKSKKKPKKSDDDDN